MHAKEALKKLTAMPPGTVFDIGSGDGQHASILRDFKFEVTTLSYEPPADRVCDYLDALVLDPFDYIWCSHFLEHQTNPGEVITHMKSDLKPDGWLFITVPPLKHDIVGGHVTLWNAGLLLYNLILGGFDCSKAKVAQYGYNISVIVQNGDAPDLNGLRHDRGDIDKLAKYFPMPVHEAFNGELGDGGRINW